MDCSLKEMFTVKSRPARLKALKAIMNTWMVNGVSVWEHIIKMIAAFEEAKVPGVVINPESQIDVVLETWPKSFTQFKLNYKMRMTLSKLMKELQAAEKIMKLKSTNLLPNASSSTTKPKVRKFRKKKDRAAGSASIGPNSKPKGKCFKCGKKGHWKKKKCPDFLAKNIDTILFLESILMVGSSSTWIVDFGVTNHICNQVTNFFDLPVLGRHQPLYMVLRLYGDLCFW
jgi:hypothetical protein